MFMNEWKDLRSGECEDWEGHEIMTQNLFQYHLLIAAEVTNCFCKGRHWPPHLWRPSTLSNHQVGCPHCVSPTFLFNLLSQIRVITTILMLKFLRCLLWKLSNSRFVICSTNILCNKGGRKKICIIFAKHQSGVLVLFPLLPNYHRFVGLKKKPIDLPS